LNYTFPFIVSLPLSFLRWFPHPLPFPLPFPLHIVCSLLFPCPFLIALRVLPTLAVLIVIAIAGTAPFTAWHSGMCPVLIIIMLVDYLIPIVRSNGQEVAWLVVLAAWWLKLSHESIATVPGEMLTGAWILPWAGCLQIGAIDLISEGTGVVPSVIVQLAAGCMKYLPHIRAEGCPPLPKRWNPAPAVWPHYLELWKLASPDRIKKDYIITEVQCSLILDAANIVYPYESTDVFRDESPYTVQIQRQESIYNWCRHGCPSSCLPLPVVAALW